MYMYMHKCSKLRAKLGLKPLDVGDSKASSSSKDSGNTVGETNGKGQTTGNSEVRLCTCSLGKGLHACMHYDGNSVAITRIMKISIPYPPCSILCCKNSLVS